MTTVGCTGPGEFVCTFLSLLTVSSVDKIYPTSCGLWGCRTGMVTRGGVGWRGGGGEERVLGEGKGCNASIAEFSGVKAQSMLPLPGCHHKPIKKAAHAAHPGLICFNFLRNIFYSPDY